VFDLEFYLHLFASAGIYLLTSEYLSTRTSVLITFLIGVFKEQFLDVYIIKSNFNVIDIYSNCIGILLAFLFDKYILKKL